MKRITTRHMLYVLVLGLAVTAWAKPKSETVTLYHDATVNGASLPAGDYVVKYEPEGKTTQVRFMKGGKEVATANAELKTLPKKAASSQVVFADEGNQHSISEIDFAGKDTAISFAASSPSAGK